VPEPHESTKRSLTGKALVWVEFYAQVAAETHAGLCTKSRRARRLSVTRGPFDQYWSLSWELISALHFVEFEAIVTFDFGAAWAETCSAALISARVCGICKILPSPSCTSRRKY
jgi:hypothetical protein